MTLISQAVAAGMTRDIAVSGLPAPVSVALFPFRQLDRGQWEQFVRARYLRLTREATQGLDAEGQRQALGEALKFACRLALGTGDKQVDDQFAAAVNAPDGEREYMRLLTRNKITLMVLAKVQEDPEAIKAFWSLADDMLAVDRAGESTDPKAEPGAVNPPA